MSRFIISDLAGNEELLLGVISDSVAVREKINNEYSVAFQIVKTEKNVAAWDMLIHEAMLSFRGENFIVKVLNKTPYSASVTALHEFFEIENDYVDGKISGLYTVQAAFAHALSATLDWTVVIDDVFEDVALDGFGDDNPLSLVQQLVVEIDAEFSFSSKSKILTVKRRIGAATQYQVRPKYNLEEIAQVFDSTSIRTAIKVHYNPDIAGKLQNTVVVQAANAHLYRRIKWAKPVDLDTYSEADAIAYGQSQLQDSPAVSVSVSFTQLREWGYDAKAIGLGDSFYLVDKRLHIDEEARIIELTTYPLTNKSPNVTLSNRKKLVTDVMLQQRKKQQQLDRQAVKQDTLYDGIEITKENGLKLTSYDGTVIWINAETGILIENGQIKKFYVDTNGNVTFDGRLRITNGNGQTTLLEAFLDTLGGRLIINDNAGNLRVEMGVFDDFLQGYMNLYSANGGGVGMRALDGNSDGGLIFVMDEYGNPISYLSKGEGVINGRLIATQDYVQQQVGSSQPSVTSIQQMELGIIQDSNETKLAISTGGWLVGHIDITPA